MVASSFVHAGITCKLAAILATLLGAGSALAQDLEPRSYANTPIGMHFAIIGYVYTTGGVALDAGLPLEDAEIEIHSEILAYAHSFALLGRSAKIDAIFPVAELSGTATFAGEPAEREVSGLGDQRIRFSYNFYGAPALTLEEYLNWHQDVIAGASLQIVVPAGQYNEDRAVNLGNNRWAFKPELGISKALGDLILELQTGVTVYTDNGDYIGGRTREQDPILAIQGHGIYSVWRGVWAALDATYYYGGNTTVNGVESDDKQSNLRLGGTLALPLSRHQSVKLFASGAVLTSSGTDFTNVGIAWQYRWGGGL